MNDTPPLPDASNPPHDPAFLDDWLRSRLDHRLTIVLLSSPATLAADAESLLASAIAPHPELRLRVERLPTQPDAPSAGAKQPALSPAAPDTPTVERALLNVEALDPDVLLVAHAPDANGGADLPRAVLRVADQLGLSDRVFVALIGPNITREYAHRLGFEDGYPLATPTTTLLRMLAREAVARDELRRHGSSPPCYL